MKAVCSMQIHSYIVHIQYTYNTVHIVQLYYYESDTTYTYICTLYTLHITYYIQLARTQKYNYNTSYMHTYIATQLLHNMYTTSINVLRFQCLQPIYTLCICIHVYMYTQYVLVAIQQYSMYLSTSYSRYILHDILSRRLIPS